MKSALLASILALSLTAVAGAADVDAGKASFEVCAACHGPNGEGSKLLNAPRLAGMPAWYTTRQLKNFKAGIRGADPKDIYGTQMRPMAMTLADDAAVDNVSAYIATLKVAKPEATLKGDVEKGKAAYATCAACHGPTGAGNEVLNSPPLAGQADWYIERQLAAYKSGLRGSDAKDSYGMQMRPMAMMLATDEAVRDVAAYIATLD